MRPCQCRAEKPLSHALNAISTTFGHRNLSTQDPNKGAPRAGDSISTMANGPGFDGSAKPPKATRRQPVVEDSPAQPSPAHKARSREPPPGPRKEGGTFAWRKNNRGKPKTEKTPTRVLVITEEALGHKAPSKAPAMSSTERGAQRELCSSRNLKYPRNTCNLSHRSGTVLEIQLSCSGL